MKIILTGCAGFIGFHAAKAFLRRGDTVIGIDNLNSYYDPSLKEARLSVLRESKDFVFYKADITDYPAMERIAKKHKAGKIVHLAAQAGVRYSITNPSAYIESNIKGTLNMLELARKFGIGHLVFASSSSVYGANKKLPFSESDEVSTPISLYAATKRAGELMCYSYSHLYGIRCACLRFFTVYGPFGRPDMALFRFTKSIYGGEEVELYNRGKMRRDFTYIDDIIKGIVAAADSPYSYEIFNLARGESVELSSYLKLIERAAGKKAKSRLEGMQPGDVAETSADISKARRMLGYKPIVSVEEGIGKFVEWYKDYYGVG